jgi:hypothetical protein
MPEKWGKQIYRSSHDLNMCEDDIREIDPGDPTELDALGKDGVWYTTPASVLWYSLAINPFLDYAFSYKEMAFVCLDWGPGNSILSIFPPLWERTALIQFISLPYPENCVSDVQMELIRDWHEIHRAKKVKLLGLHATVYQPFSAIGFNDLSQGKVFGELIMNASPPEYHPTNVSYQYYTSDELIWGAIVNENHREDFIGFLRGNHINLVLSGHSHRNTIFQICRDNQGEHVRMYRPQNEEDRYGLENKKTLDLTKPLFVSTTSAGPLGFLNNWGVAEHRHGKKEREKIHSGFRIIRFSNSGEIISLDTSEVPTPHIRESVQIEFKSE